MRAAIKWGMLLITLAVLAITGVLALPPLMENVGPSSSAPQNVKPGPMPEGQPYGVNSDSPFYVHDIVNYSFAYIGASSVSGFVVEYTTACLNVSGAYPLLWIEEPDPSSPANVDVLLVDGFWIMENTDLALSYIASFLSLDEPTLRYLALPSWEREYLDEHPWLKARIVIILPSFKPKELLIAINSSSLVLNGIIKPIDEVELYDIGHLTELEKKWTVFVFYLPHPGMPFYEQYGNGTLYRIEDIDYSCIEEGMGLTDFDEPLTWRWLIWMLLWELPSITLYGGWP